MTKSKASVPALVYVPFISFFEAQVTEAQKRIREVETWENTYSQVMNTLRQWNQPWPHKINVSALTMGITITIPFEATLAEMGKLAQAIEDSFTPSGRLPEKAELNLDCDVTYVKGFAHPKGRRNIVLRFVAPQDGTCELEFEHIPRENRWTESVLRARQAKFQVEQQ